MGQREEKEEGEVESLSPYLIRANNNWLTTLCIESWSLHESHLLKFFEILDSVRRKGIFIIRLREIRKYIFFITNI